MSADWPENSRWLKPLVIGMTALLVLGLIAFVIGMAGTAGRLAEHPAAIGEIVLPAGDADRILATTAVDGRLFLTLRPAAGRDFVLILDAESGRVLGRLRLGPGE